MRRAERGMALLEVLAALTILAVAGLALTQLVAGAVRATATAQQREVEQADEDRLLTAYTLLTRGDLDLRLGSRDVGAYVMTIARPERTLYRIAVARDTAPTVEDLVTVVYRPSPAHAP